MILSVCFVKRTLSLLHSRSEGSRGGVAASPLAESLSLEGEEAAVFFGTGAGGTSLSSRSISMVFRVLKGLFFGFDFEKYDFLIIEKQTSPIKKTRAMRMCMDDGEQYKSLGRGGDEHCFVESDMAPSPLGIRGSEYHLDGPAIQLVVVQRLHGAAGLLGGRGQAPLTDNRGINKTNDVKHAHTHEQQQIKNDLF